MPRRRCRGVVVVFPEIRAFFSRGGTSSSPDRTRRGCRPLYRGSRHPPLSKPLEKEKRKKKMNKRKKNEDNNNENRCNANCCMYFQGRRRFGRFNSAALGVGGGGGGSCLLLVFWSSVGWLDSFPSGLFVWIRGVHIDNGAASQPARARWRFKKKMPTCSRYHPGVLSCFLDTCLVCGR